MQDRGPAAYIAEFVGTLLLVFFITAVVSLYLIQPSAQNPLPFIDFSVIGLVHTFVLFGLIQTLGLISGAHFNPAVTVAMTALRQINIVDAAIYIVAQLGGGVAGALLTKALLLDEGRGIHYGATLVSNRLDGDILPGMLAEGLGTFFLVWVIVGVAVNPRATREWAALAIGAALGMGVMVMGPLTGAGFNPARSTASSEGRPVTPTRLPSRSRGRRTSPRRAITAASGRCTSAPTPTTSLPAWRASPRSWMSTTDMSTRPAASSFSESVLAPGTRIFRPLS